MAEKNMNARIVHKHDTAANWSKATTFIPKQGELIIYDRDSNYNYERFKIGDGATTVNNLPFTNELTNLGIYIGDTQPTNPNIKIWINTAEEGTGVVPVLPRLTTVTLTAAKWTGSTSPYSQVATVNGVTANSKLDLQPTAAQIVSLQNEDIALMAENNAGNITFYSFGGKPSMDYTMQVLLTEVSYV
jgi:hypothetical protein